MIEKLRAGCRRQDRGARTPGVFCACVLPVLLLLSALAGPPLSAQERSAPQTTADLLRTGDRNAREGKYVEALLAWKRAYERRFSGFRDVPFLFPVGADFLDRAGLRKQLIDEFEKELPEEKAEPSKFLIDLIVKQEFTHF